MHFRALVNHYREPLRVGPPRTSLDGILPDKDYVELNRVKASHKGIGQVTRLRELAAGSVNQDYMDEIGMLTNLERLDFRGRIAVKDLSPLRNLKKLRTLRFESASSIEDFTPIAELPALENLQIENAPKISDFSWLTPLKDQLKVLGIEGTVNKDQRVESFEFLRGFSALEALFIMSIVLKSKDISPLIDCPNLKLLDGTRAAAKAQFTALETANPDLVCPWFGREFP